MDLRELNYIVTLADEGSISRAAEKLFMAQSSLSQFLSQYEAELGAVLFMRTSRGIRPTASGEVFLGHARQILLQYRRAQNELWDIEGMNGGQIELGVSTFRGTYLMPPVLKRFHEIYPNVQVHITEMDSVDLENQILEGALDIALIALPAVKLKHTEFLMKDEIYIVASKDHPIMDKVRRGEREYIELEDAAPFEFILGPPGTILGRIARREFQKRGLEPVAHNTNFTAAFAASMAREGVGLALTYQSCAVPDDNAAYLRIGEEGVFLDLALTYPVGEYRSKATVTLARVMRTMFQD